MRSLTEVKLLILEGISKGKRPIHYIRFEIVTAPVPLKGVPYIQELFFEPLDYHIKTHKNWLLHDFLGAATNRERSLLARVGYVNCQQCSF